jgi:enterochelin esterase-like enzyme
MTSHAITPTQSPLPWPTATPEVTVGRIERIDNFPSQYVDPRPIDVWLPPGYDPAKRYAVLYMHDGQMLFDASKSWNKSAWNVHLALNKLMQEGKVHDTIVVGIPNNGKYRYSEYYPDKMLARTPAAVREDYQRRAQWGFTLADAYLKFVALELKPAIDARFSTRADRANTVVMGSSMGGLISLYALCEYPEVFGAAAGLSTHWVGRPGAWGYPDKVQNASMPLAAFTYLQTHLPKQGLHRIYTDHGTTALDSLYGVHQDFADQLFKDKGYTAGLFVSRVFEGTGHSENDWAARVAIPLLFLLGLPSKSQP